MSRLFLLSERAQYNHMTSKMWQCGIILQSHDWLQTLRKSSQVNELRWTPEPEKVKGVSPLEF
jgi:hypothetical protein